MGRAREYFVDKGLTPTDVVPAFVCVTRASDARRRRIKRRRRED